MFFRFNIEKRLVLVLLLVIFPALLFSANSGSVSGTILDKERQKLAGAIVSIMKANTGKVLKGEITNNKGEFHLDDLAEGNYTLKVTYIGYKNKLVTPLVIDSKKYQLSIGDILLDAASVTTNEVEVTARKQAVQSDIDKIVLNVESNLSVAGGSALDVLQTAPSVNVDIEGNVSIRGNSNIKILIDGRPSGIDASNLLEMIPASSIESIEIITNPSAKYEAEGTSGILNIILKKKKNDGFNGLVSANAGTGDKFNVSVNLNYRFGDFNVYANYDNRFFAMKGYGWSDQTILTEQTSNSIYQNYDFWRRGYSHNNKIGIEYTINEFNTISAFASYNFGMRYGRDTTMFFNQNVDGSNRTANQSSVNADSYPYKNIDLTMSYRHNFGEKQHDLTADFTMNSSVRDAPQDYVRRYFNPYSEVFQKSAEVGNNKTYTFQSDYGNPISKDGRFESGIRYSLKNYDQDYKFNVMDNVTNIYTLDTKVSNHFVYKENVGAFYLNYVDKFDALKYQVGLRSEYTWVEGNQQTTGENFTNSYIGFFPSAFLKYDFNTVNSVKLNYSRRINRPWVRQLNPFIDSEDPLNLEVGNPKLKPEFMNSFELGNMLNYETSAIYSTIFYRLNEQVMTEVRTPIDSIRTLSREENLLRGTTYGAELMWSQDIVKGWKFDISGSYYNNSFKGTANNQTLSNSSNSWNTKFTSYINLFGMLDFQFSVYYYAPEIEAQEQQKANYWSDMGLKYITMDGNLTFNARLSDAFATMRHSNTTMGNGFYGESYRMRASRVLYIGFSYKFNDYKRQNQKRLDDSRGSEDFE
jgi:outer membrane receptor protein involved in Fe transport